MVKVLSSMDIAKGAKADRTVGKLGSFTQPIQFIPDSEKNTDWASQNMDWFELIGLKQVRRNARRLLKNYKLANGLIDKTDYIVEEDNETADMIDILTTNDESAFDLKFFAIIPNIVNVMIGEFAKRNDKITYRAVDDYSYNEMLEQKRTMIEQTLLSHAEQKMQQMIAHTGIEENSEEAQQMLSPENLKTLPEIQQYFNKDYRSSAEQWAKHQHNVDEERFKIKELENYGFRDSLVADREFWHFVMREDDYDIELWNPVLTFYHKSPEVRYISQGNWTGKFDMMSVADVVDKFGYMMNEEQLERLEDIFPIKAAGYVMPGVQNDGGFYDATKSHKWNTTGDSLGMRQHRSFNDLIDGLGDSTIDDILQQSEDLMDSTSEGLLRVTTVYWKSQKKLGHLTSVGADGAVLSMIVDETFKITETPVYDKTLKKEESKETIIYGEHIDWIWINEVWGGLKIGPNRATTYVESDENDFEPIYLNVKPTKFQFKGDFSLYGCKLPVEGAVFSDRNTKSTSLVDKMKPYQIGFNLVNNQIADILIDELGTVVMLDQNALPKHSMGEDWGHNNMAKAYVAMKDFQMLPLDTSITNTENATNFNHYSVLNMEQTSRLMSRVSLAEYFKKECFETIGISQQRIGAVNSQETATGVEQAVNASYSQTDIYFTQHSEYLMPRIHQMRTDLAQYYHSTNPSIRLQYLTSMDEKINFEMNGTDLLLKELNVFVTTKVNHREMMEQMKNLALNNNTAGASIFDLGGILKADSMAEIDHVMKDIEKKTNDKIQSERDHAQKLEQQRIEAEAIEQDKVRNFEHNESELDRQNDINVAEIRAASATGLVDINKNEQSDYIDTLEYLDKKQDRDQTHNLNREKETNKKVSEQKKINLKREEIRSKEKIANSQLAIAKENKTKSELQAKGKLKKDK